VTGDAPLTLRDGFLRSAAAHPDRIALEVDEQPYTYAELHGRAAAIAATLQRDLPDADPPLTAVFAARSVTAFAGVLGVLMRGHGYVPLNPGFPPDRTRLMLARAGCRAVIVDAETEPLLDEVLEGMESPPLVVRPDAGGLASPDEWTPERVDPEAIAYLLFTSGSTGVPKGVMVAHRNIRRFVDVMAERYGIVPEDRFSQTFDMTFDLSLFDMFVAWERGACVCCPPEAALMSPGRFIKNSALTVWFSVPSTGVFMRRLKQLKPDSYPTLRWSLFCGEPLPAQVARDFASAAPNSTLENLYGPTEVTLACTLYRWDAERSSAESELGLVPIGSAYPEMTALVVDEDLREVPPGGDGELLMSGPQVALGYWRDDMKTRAAFIVPPGRSTLHYRTGDRVRRPEGDGPLTYRGRVDQQIKVLGHRVELGEIEAAIRRFTDIDAAVALGWPPTSAGVGGVVAFVGDTTLDVGPLLTSLRRVLPPYMVPREIHLVETLPLNANGKYDRNALRAQLAQTRQATFT
jgi:amino acid adenylation domain-containing protein